MNNLDRNIVIYHANCTDGFTSAWIVKRYVEDQNYDKFIYIPMNYVNESKITNNNYTIKDKLLGKLKPYGINSLEDLNGKKMYVLDFSFNRQFTLELMEHLNSLVILDHHKTAQEELESLKNDDSIYKKYPTLNIRFDMYKSGCTLTWEYFTSMYAFKQKQKPWFIDYVEDRDLWKWKLLNSKEINAVIGSYEILEPTLDGSIDNSYDPCWINWDEIHNLLLTCSKDELIERGKMLLKYKEQLINRIIKNANPSSMIVVKGYQVLCVNSPVFQSEIGERLCYETNPNTKRLYPFGVVWSAKKNMNNENNMNNNSYTYIFSLRSRNDFDVSEIAKSFGGGGHKNASGFTLNSMDELNPKPL